MPFLSASALSASLGTFVSDFLVILLVLGIFILYGAWKGRSGLAALIFGVFISYVLYTHLPFAIPVLGSALQNLLLKAGLLFGLAILLNVLFLSFIHIDTWAYGFMRFLGPAVLMVAGAGMSLAILFQTLKIATVYPSSPYITMLFTPPEYFFWWLLAPVVAVLIFSRA